MTTRITVNGKEYASVEEMPPDVRAQYDKTMAMFEDRDGNGIPDILEGKGGGITSMLGGGHGRNSMTSVVKTTTRVVVNGREGESLKDLPAEIRQAMEGASKISSASAGPVPVIIRGNISFHLGWPLLLALVAAMAVTGAVIWFFR